MNDSDISKMFIAAMRVARNSTYGFPGFDNEPKPIYESLGDGFELRPIPLTKKEAADSRIVNLKYSHLYYNGERVSDNIFRKGGMGGIFKDGYCELIHYIRTDKKGESDSGFDFGTFVIVNEFGEISLRGERYTSDHPYHIGGRLASIGKYVYDLHTGNAISPKGSTWIKGETAVIIEHRYDWYDKEVKLPIGIYSIDYKTAEITKLDDIKK